jgi:late competence protein required for DNA uptake (superfamily II DNA/RNA helicase)
MIERKLTKEEEEHIKKFVELNHKRAYIQNLVVTEFAKHKKYIANLFTSSGKTRIVYYAIKRMQAKFGTTLPLCCSSSNNAFKRRF